ncbi:DUF7619 domain-containing protein [Chryseobacterium sp. MP_3.2]|uniref:DUF7619 domain-containing protein n=1 Tax=Chryseobacterium sp. MP_3.2 TaxID=3071712 RepID=UPI002DFD1B05|nr:putative repeat protein (TIGR01451 family) [Chryseobacterium sp. MP_3.2]
MKKIYFILFLISISFSFLKAQNLNIPDANFKQYLVSEFDTSGDGEIQTSEALAVTSISCSSKNISSMEGIKSFSNLQILNCSSNNIVNLDLRSLNKLKKISCSYNTIAMQSLNISGLTNLEDLNFLYNRLPTLNVLGLLNLKNLIVTGNYLTSLDVSGLSKLTILRCNSNFLTSLTVNNAVNLQEVNCSTNKLAVLDVSKLSNLKYLYSSYNQLTSVNVAGLANLIGLDCEQNMLTTINLQGLTSLLNLEIGHNRLTTLNVSGLKGLGAILCYNNKLTSIIFSGEYPILNNLFCYNNEFTALDLNHLPLLQTLEVYNNPNLERLLIKNGMDQNYFLKIENTNLKYICCDDFEYEYVQNMINQLGFQNQCAVNTYCSFTLGGNYNTIGGITKFDKNGNGCEAGSELISSIKYAFSDGTNTGFILGDYNGSYKNEVGSGTFVISPIFENPDYFTASPPTMQFVFANNNNNSQTQNFCITPKGTKNDLEVNIIPVNSVRPGFNTTFKLIYKNKGNTILSGTLNFKFDQTKSQFIAADLSPDSQILSTLSWNLTDLKPFETKTISITLKTNTPPVVNINDVLNYSSKIKPVMSDVTEDDNTFNLQQMVIGSFDPNDKTCLQGSVITPDLIGKYVTYKIRFENTGTANAEQVVIKDVINTSMFDVSSIIPITASHFYQTKITGNRVEFIFDNIDLPFEDDYNDGYIVFKIKTLPSLMVGSQIKNKASIFFDYNLPIVTNEFSSVFQTLSNAESFLKNEEVKIYPNPVRDFLHFETESKVSSVTIYDVAGRMVQKDSVDESRLDVRVLKKGYYFLKLETDKGYFVKKIMKE